MVSRVCLVSGGTGGHLMPALVLARALRARGHDPVLVTEGRDVERELLRRELPDVVECQLPSARGSRLGLPLWLLRATATARRLLREQHVDAVVSTGGRPSVPVGLAARSLGLPLFLLEQNAITGRANRWLSPFARRIYHGLPAVHAIGARSLLTGTPLRPEIGRIDRQVAREELGLPLQASVVLVTGGSQGARSLNEAVPKALLRIAARLPQRPLHVLHLAGLGRDEEVRRTYASGERDVLAQVRPVAQDMARLFAAADLVVCRGGGTTVAELCAVGRAAVIVPYPHHKDRQQLRNAEVLARAGAAVIVEEPQLTVERLADLLQALFADPQRLAAMGLAARALQIGDPVATILADMGVEPGAAAVVATASPAPRTIAGGAS
jgi:UDP-N-acetylglucosamine--N-acetylmuramyl-(pentapeptide) pyrophosphoryl-undecaprenol N-acetylglucosamine transferase